MYKNVYLTLRTLETDGVVSRTMYPEIPTRVEYCLTPLGESLLPHWKGSPAWQRKTC
ncbi:MAG: winged helix-turn-helix transcriptional regulator [Bacteroidetes bacterium]|nr:winged helix-turn-helix transcriptional regulator [Bacteroidota bacterium]